MYPTFQYADLLDEACRLLPDGYDRCSECERLMKEDAPSYIEEIPFCVGCVACSHCGQTATVLHKGELFCTKCLEAL